MKNQSGKAGEEHIARWLESQGYEILARNFHSTRRRATCRRAPWWGRSI